MSLAQRNALPAAHTAHPLGTDQLGRDSLARLSSALRLHVFYSGLFLLLAGVIAIARLAFIPRPATKVQQNTSLAAKIANGIAVALLIMLTLCIAFIALLFSEASPLISTLIVATTTGYVLGTQTSANSKAMLMMIGPLWLFLISYSGLTPKPPNALLGTLMSDHRFGRTDFYWVIITVLALLCFAIASLTRLFIYRKP